MYLRHFALVRFPFHDALEADELFDSTANTEAPTKGKRGGGSRHCLEAPVDTSLRVLGVR